jgi:hypothetical protein
MKSLTDKGLMILGLALVAAVMAVPPAFAGSDRGVDRWAANALRDSGRYGTLDPWVYNAIHAAEGPTDMITENSAGQHPAVRLAASPSVSAIDGTRGFSFRDASVGAAIAVAAMIVLMTSLVVRRRRVVQAL